MLLEATTGPKRGRALLASVLVVLTVIGVWKFIDYRMQPPPPPKAAVSDQ